MWWNIDPWREMDRMRREIDRIAGGGITGVRNTFPLVNVYDAKDDVLVTAELPGLTRDEVQISFADGVLTIRGNRKSLVDSEKYAVLRQERSIGQFEKDIAIPQKVNAEKISASFKDGVLSVTLPKAEESKPRQISIEVK